MRPVNYRPLLLMIHGVNSTLEWSVTVLKVLEPHFRCQPVHYRYFHTIWGPIKVYIWPLAFLFLAAYCVLSFPIIASRLRGQPDILWKWTGNLISASGGNSIALLILVALLVIETFIVIKAETEWMKKVEKLDPVWLPPLVFGLTGVVGALICRHPWQWAFPMAALSGNALFLDLREYTKSLSWYTLITLPLAMMFIVGWLVYSIFTRQTLIPSNWIIIVFVIAALVEPFWRGNLAFAKVRQELQKAQNQSPLPFVIAHSLGTYLTGHILHETLQLRLGRILFTGCVLDRRYPWHQLVPPQRNALISVTNYVGQLDIVPLVAGCLRSFWLLLVRPFPDSRFTDFLGRLTTWRALGMAGFLGFNQEQFIVHTLYPRDGTQGLQGFVHNINHGWARHSTLNRDKSFQSWGWLPCLWGMSPFEYDEWLGWCRLGSFYGMPALDSQGHPIRPYRPQNPDGFFECEVKLRQSKWSWPSAPELATPTKGRTLDEYVGEILNTIQGTEGRMLPEQVMKRLPMFLFDTVTQAFQETEKVESQDLEKLERLHPQAALRHAVLMALT